MEGRQRIYYALGQLAHVVAMADGEVQKEEMEKMHEMIGKEIEKTNDDFSYSDIIFELLAKSETDPELIFEQAFKEIQSASYYLTDDMKSDFPAILEKVARSFQPYTDEEAQWVEKIKKRLEDI